jgi:hypothetical protein
VLDWYSRPAEQLAQPQSAVAIVTHPAMVAHVPPPDGSDGGATHVGGGDGASAYRGVRAGGGEGVVSAGTAGSLAIHQGRVADGRAKRAAHAVVELKLHGDAKGAKTKGRVP